MMEQAANKTYMHKIICSPDTDFIDEKAEAWNNLSSLMAGQAPETTAPLP